MNQEYYRSLLLRGLTGPQRVNLVLTEKDIENNPDRKDPRFFQGQTDPTESATRRKRQLRKWHKNNQRQTK